MGKRREFLKGGAAKLTTWDVAPFKTLNVCYFEANS